LLRQYSLTCYNVLAHSREHKAQTGVDPQAQLAIPQR
jgi:hypothetical protein